MQKIDSLFQLIKALSKSEKRFFKIYSSRHVIGQQNNYVKLFEYIDKQKLYEEDKLVKHFKNERFIKRLPVAKSYLHELILKSMNTYHANNSVYAKINEAMRSIEFLYDKGLYEQAQKQLTKAKKLAEKYHRLSLLHEIIRWEKEIWEAQRYENKSEQDLEQLHLEERELIAKLNNLNDYWKLQSRLYYLHNVKGIVRNREDLDRFEDVFNSPLMTTEENALSFNAHAQYCKVYATYFFIIRDFKSCYRYIRRMVEIIEEHPEVIEDNPQLYINSVQNLLNMSDALGKRDETKHYLGVLQGMIENQSAKYSDNERLKLFEGYYYHMLKMNIDTEQYDKGLTYANEVQKGLELYAGKINQVSELMLCYYVFRLHLEAKKLDDAKQWIDKIINGDYETARPDIYRFAVILNLILAYERKDKNITKTIKKTYHHLIKGENITQFDQTIIRFIRNLATVEETKDLQNLFEQLKDTFKELQKDPFESKAFDYFDFIDWIEEQGKMSKIKALAN